MRSPRSLRFRASGPCSHHRKDAELVIRTLFVASRPLSWVNTAFPFAAAYFLDAAARSTSRSSSARSTSSSRTTSRCTGSTTCSTTSPTCAIRARAASRAPCSTARSTGPHSIAAARREHSVPGISRGRRVAALLAGARDQRLRRGRVLRAGPAASRNGRSSTRSPPARTSSRRRSTASCSRAPRSRRNSGRWSARSSCGASPRTRSAPCRTSPADREGGIASIATVIGGQRHGQARDRLLPARRHPAARCRLAGPARRAPAAGLRRSTWCRGGTSPMRMRPRRIADGAGSSG